MSVCDKVVFPAKIERLFATEEKGIKWMLQEQPIVAQGIIEFNMISVSDNQKHASER